MRQVINRKLYDTERATIIHEWDNGCYAGDLNLLSEELYKTKKGSLFLYRSGGALAMRRQAGNAFSGGDEIVPLTKDQAIEWLESHEGTHAILREFPDSVGEA